MVSGVTFATNNFVAILDHQELPNEFHIIQDFLTSSPLKFALTEPASVSFKSVMQVWNSVTFDKGHSDSILMSFEYDGITHYVTPVIVEDALHLPVLGDAVPDNVSDSTLFEFVTKLGYNGEVKRYGNFFRTKLKKEWNFFFDTISRFLNKTSNFDALPSGSLKIGYSLIHSTVFDYGYFILKALSDRKSDKLVLPICRITENNIKSLVNSDKANGFIGNAFIPDESKQSTTTSNVSQKTLVVKAKKSARTDVSGRQSSSKDFSSTPLTKKKLQEGVQGVLVKKAAKGVEAVSVKRKLVLRDETDSDDDLPIASIMNVNKEVFDTAFEAVAPSSKPQKERTLSKSRYHIPLKVQMKDTNIQTSNPDESSTPDALANPDVGIPDAKTKVVSISDSPAKASPSAKIVEISWDKVAETASKLRFSHPLEKKRKAAKIVFKRQKKLKGSSPQEPGSQSDSAAQTEDPATQEPLNQTTQEPSSQSEDAGKATASSERLVKDTVNEGSTQEPPTQSVEAALEPHATQEPLVTDTDASLSNPDGVHPDASGAPDAEPILIQPLRSRPMDHPITDSQDKLKGIAIPDPDVTHDDDSDDSDNDNNDEKEQLARVLKSSLGTN
ncbi:hypothetical protein POM88_021330 [Heracleum sosnowskyi]|uniref:Uncharacterized protein n=1 Tax=Heracleum sosnowskyi TaxID=360622 RepID=A0AAD8MNT8_9APIA|nr:hypothetical protein POM88_021330 [Heracleum sosnowskyi]